MNMNVEQFIEPDWKQTIKLAGELIEIKSTSTFDGNEKILEYVKDHLDGMEAKIVKPPDAPPYLVARICCQDPEFKMILSGHLDTVEEGGMKHPFTPTFRDGYLFGRGAADMKGGCAAMIMAMKEFAKIPSRKGDVFLIFTLDEEIGSHSIQHAIENEIPVADLAIIGEPSGLSLIVSHKGCQWMKVAFHGKACHASIPREGRNAVVMASEFIGAIEKYSQAHFPGRHHHFCGLPTVSVGTIRGGGGCPNIVPDYCEIMIDRRWNPNETIEQVWQDMRTIIDICKRRNPEFNATLEQDGMDKGRIYPPLDFSGQDKLIALITEAISKAGFPRIRQEHFSCWTEGAMFEMAGTPAVIFGPGDLKKAHTLDECVETTQIVKAAKAYFSILANLGA
jgi:acetylornithine deacetylase/succinyl-diaminopimelate desuccinylase family protein